ncbi:hypothetical protein DOTSEDRAFT_72185 [Dothistroma septosporum NZE10]|uniref:CCZ1/INTU/HSP4 first Longin domain-containing protein n=1 Tax=Dothistroma septosporum (strain NZE10 / CBS 128990) TaxID=675120 RepID=N1PNZ1_DOTSN|nr:hypothetical protein DOTSEDRAFT_72185 [Dothistroma septosporum NZE10]
MLQAHYVFSLHHGPSLSDMFVKLSRNKFCSTLDRFWTRFARTWDVLLHGNPATDVFSALKLSRGGELGMGVGEEEWGSGERDVLEDLTRRTDGLVDLVVSRFGDSAPATDYVSASEIEALPWLGGGNTPSADDGIVFGGINAITRPSLRNVSLWMRQIYTYGDYAYGVRDNPSRERRKRRRPNAPVKAARRGSVQDEERGAIDNGNGVRDPTKASKHISVTDHPSSISKSKAKSRPSVRGQDDPFVVNNDGAQDRHPGIPPPIVEAAQQSLNNTSNNVNSEHQQGHGDDANTTLGIPDQYMKYMTFGLSTLMKPTRPEPAKRTSTSSAATIKASKETMAKFKTAEAVPEDDVDPPEMTQVDPSPDGQTEQDKIAMQKRQEETGLFVIGLKGDLDDVPDDPNASIDEIDDESDGLRNILRTVQVEVVPKPTERGEQTALQRTLSDAGLDAGTDDPLNYKRLRVLVYVHRPFMYCLLFESREHSLSIASFYKGLHHSLLPIYKPMVASTNPSRVTQRIQETQAQASEPSSDTASVMSGSNSSKAAESKPIYDLIYDPALLTAHTTLPNIPDPGTPAAEGIVSSKKGEGPHHPRDWTRVEALNVHSQILNSLASTQRSHNEYERTSKTSRGWWVVWMKLPPSNTRDTSADGDRVKARQDAAKGPSIEGLAPSQHAPGFPATLRKEESDDTVTASMETSKRFLASTIRAKKREPSMNRIAFLVRKASDAVPVQKASTSSRAASSMWQTLSLRGTSTSDEATGGANAGWGPAALAGGIGIDARKYVEGLLQLNR